MAQLSHMLLALVAVQAAIIVNALHSAPPCTLPCSAPIPAGCDPRNDNGTFFNPPLPYPYDFLEPVIDNTTMFLHHDRHTQTYVNNLNIALTALPTLRDNLTSLSELVRKIGVTSFNTELGIPANWTNFIRNNAGGVWNHNQFFRMMTAPNASNPNTTLSPALKSKIVARWGSIANMTSALQSAGASVFGSGWAWLVYRDPANCPGELDIITTPNQDNPLMEAFVASELRGIPLLGVDVWEHAYYLTYRNVRTAYLSAWVSLIDWARVQRNYRLAVKGESQIDKLYC